VRPSRSVQAEASGTAAIRHYSERTASRSDGSPVLIYSGATRALLTTVFGGSNDHLGGSLGAHSADLEGERVQRVLVAGRSPSGGTPTAASSSATGLFPLSPTTYCLGKLNSLGCTPSIVTAALRT